MIKKGKMEFRGSTGYPLKIKDSTGKTIKRIIYNKLVSTRMYYFFLTKSGRAIRIDRVSKGLYSYDGRFSDVIGR